MKVLFFGPYPPPITGQSTSFKMVYDSFEGKKLLCNNTKYGDRKVFNTLYCLFRLIFLFSFKGFDKVYFTCSRTPFGFIKDFFLLLLCKMFNIKVINHLHGADFSEFYNQSKILRGLIHWSYKKVSISIVLLPAMKSQFACFPGMEVKVIPNSYPPEFSHIEVELSKKKKQLTFLSNLMESKGVLVFLKALDSILSFRKDLIVKIAGSPMGDHLSSAKEIEIKFFELYNNLRLKYPEQLFFLGTVQGDEKIELLISSSLFILPTFYPTEAFPISIIEAMRCGNAILTTNHNYLPNIIGEENGELIRIMSVKDLIQSVNYLLDQEQNLQRIQEFNMNFAQREYSPEMFLGRINDTIISC